MMLQSSLNRVKDHIIHEKGELYIRREVRELIIKANGKQYNAEDTTCETSVSKMKLRIRTEEHRTWVDLPNMSRWTN